MSDICLKIATFNIVCYDNYDRPNNTNLIVGLYQREKSIFKRPIPPLYVEVKNNKKSLQTDFYDLDSAQNTFVKTCIYWSLHDRYEKMTREIESTGYSHWFYNDSLDYTLDTMPLLKRSDLYSGLLPTSTSLEYKISSNQITVFLLYCQKYDNVLGQYAEQFKSVGLKLSANEKNIAWKVSSNAVILCRYDFIEDFENVYNNKIQVTEELYKHPNPQKFMYIAIPKILTTVADPILCKNPLYW